MKAGDEIIWTYTPRGGYGYSYPVAGEVIKVGNKRILIKVPLAKGGFQTRWVKAENLKARCPA